jgi:hypothetical protein
MAKGKRKASSTATGKDKNKNDEVDWIAALAKEASTSASSSKPGTKSNAQILTKSQRIEKRNAKKRRREERKRLTSAASSEDGDNPRVIASNARNRRAERDPEALKALSEDHMDRLSQIMHDTVERINDGKSYKERRFLKPFVPAKKGKATKNQQLSDDLIQVCTMALAIKLLKNVGLFMNLLPTIHSWLCFVRNKVTFSPVEKRARIFIFRSLFPFVNRSASLRYLLFWRT